MLSGGMSAQAARAGRQVSVDVLVVEPREDHRELMAEVLEPAFPGAVWLAEQPRTGLGPPRVLVVSLQSQPGPLLDWLESLGDERPAIIALTGPDRRWSTADERRLGAPGRLDKRAGPAFLEDLVATVREALGESERAARPSSTARAERTAPAASPAAGPGGRRPDAHSAEAKPLVRRAVIEQLTEELKSRARYLSGAAEQLSHGLEVDGGSLSGLRRESERCRALADRLSQVLCLEPVAPRRHRVLLCDLLELRQDAWRAIAGDEERIAVRSQPVGPTAAVSAAPVGEALDGLVDQLLEPARSAGIRLLLRCDAVLMDEATASLRPGLQAGRCTRLRVGLDPAEAAPRDVALPRSLRATLIAAAKGEGGYFEEGPEGGPAFTLYVPVRDRPRSRWGGAPRVAVVDDDEPMQELCSAVIEEAGGRPAAISRGEELLDRVRAGCAYDLILLDLAMPGLDGAATYDALRRIDPAVPVVVVSGGVKSAQRVQSLLEAGVLGVLAKPFDVPRLVRVIRCALGPAAAPQELAR